MLHWLVFVLFASVRQQRTGSQHSGGVRCRLGLGQCRPPWVPRQAAWVE